MAPRYFTLEEANAQVPQLEDIFGRVLRLRAQMRAYYQRLEEQGFAPKGESFTPEVKGAPPDVVRTRAVFKSLLELLRGELGEVSASAGRE